ncbi:CAAX amino terminal protease [Candidatus Photodesmus katoptron]|uniref:CPBP family intramembrane glutamic endopeptidase n=1 Tax=Candidatus Photodesmus anomalopis TaxID=28176 RepID=UPI0004D3C4C5|nr:CPBP family intramembrane glutamic endopeptidase [Candidatus Photodesmus katoptron]KEY90238.1 CAAX amino terminal protease [Candidatus Photodesmus katoptron]
MILESSSLIIWVLLAFAIILSFLRRTLSTIIVLSTTLIAAFFLDQLDISALISTILIFILSYKTPLLKKKWKQISLSIITLWSLGVFFHVIPGFHNFKVLDNVIAGPKSSPFTMYLNLDKPLIFFVLLLALPKIMEPHPPIPNIKAIFITIFPLFSLLFIASLIKAIQLELTIPSWWWIFAFNNLLFTCVSEESFFRAYIQKNITTQIGWIPGLVLASLLFGLAHFSGGLLLIFFSTLAGLGYGSIFHFSHRLWVGVLFHFLFNFIHLIFFTYPILAK